MSSADIKPRGFDAIFAPRSIAILGASTEPHKTGGRPVHLLKQHGYTGAIYPVNPKVTEVQGLRAYPSLADLPDVPDLILVVLPAAITVDAVRDAAMRGVGAAIVMSSGFAENGAEGENMQRQIAEIAKQSGMRVLGPNCLGAVSVSNRVIGSFSISLEKNMPAAGRISIVSQSGNIGSAALRMLEQIGVARFIATGNEADIEASDAIAWLAQDDQTDVILCCLETCRDGARLRHALKTAHQAGKPIAILKIGSSEAGQKAAQSHTGGLAGSDRVFSEIFRHYGAVQVTSLEDLVQFGAASVTLGKRKIGERPSVALIAASGGFGVMMADAASKAGLAINEIGEEARARIAQVLPLAATANPIDATAQMSANPKVLSQLLAAILDDGRNSVACLMMALSMELPRLRSIYIEALSNASRNYPDKVIAACISGPADAIKELRALGIICLPSIDSMMNTLAALGRLEKRTRLSEITIQPKALPDGACRNEATAKKALAAAGIPFPQEIIATTSNEAAEAARQINMPLAMKILSPDIQHKSDIGGVMLNIAVEDAAAAFEQMKAQVSGHQPQAQIDGVLLSPMLVGGTELIVGTITDPIFGPAVMVGLGGIYAEIFQDTSLRLAPVTPNEALEMLCELKAFPFLNGARGREPADLDAAAQIVSALSEFAMRHTDDVAEIDINPLLLRGAGKGAVALDALIVPAASNHRINR